MKDREQKLISRMWAEVPADVYETAPSSSGLFEREEISAIGELVADLVSPSDAHFYLFGSATAFREEAALREASKRSGKTLQIGKITAVDIAPQFLKLADERLERLKNEGEVQQFETILGSVDEVRISDGYRGIALLGVYDLNCLLNSGTESNDEAVGLDEYGEGMRTILGPETTILPLEFRNGLLSEGLPILSYTSPRDYSKIREELRSYYEENKEIVGMRVHLKHEDGIKDSNNSLFVSTWFNIDSLQGVMRSFGLRSYVRSTDAKKGSVLVVRDQGIDVDEKVKTCVLAMNNVLGNLAEGSVITNFFGKLRQVCVKGKENTNGEL